MKRDTQVIDQFYIKGYSHNHIMFQLLIDEYGRYEIKRAGVTLLFFSKEQQARKGFESLKGGRGKLK